MVLKMLEKIRHEEECGLSDSLRLIAAELGMGMKFEDVLCSAGESDFGKKLALAHERIRAGENATNSLSRIMKSSDSLAVKRACSALIQCYSKGGSEKLCSLANELSLYELAIVKEFSARASMLSIAFVSFACIIPLLFLIVGVLGASVFGDVIEVEDLLIVLTLSLLAITFFAWIITPKFLSSGESFFSNKERFAVNDYLESRNAKWLASNYVLFILAYPLASYLASRRRKSAEKFLPDSLMQASSESIDAAISSICLSGYGDLSKQFSFAEKQISVGQNIPLALAGIWKRLGSKFAKRACDLLSCAYETGADLGEAMRSTADDLIRASAAEKEKSALLAVPRYTIFAGLVLVPFILSRAVAAFGSFPQHALLEYLVIFSFFSALFLAVQEAEPRKAVLYAPIFIPLAILVFFGTLSFI